MKWAKTLLCFLPILLITPSAYAAHITQNTLEAWSQQVQQAKAKLQRSPELAEPLLQAPSEVNVESAQPTGMPVPSGLIHHWTGTEFIPNVHVAELLGSMQDYDAYAEIFAPAVTESHLLSRGEQVFTYRLKMVQKALGVRTGLIAEFQSRYVQLDPRSGYSVTEATHLIELQNPGKPNERLVPSAASRGFVVRMFTVMRYRERDGGVLVEVDSMTLSRDVPSALRWIVTPFIERFSRQTMTSTLERIKLSAPEPHGLSSVASK